MTNLLIAVTALLTYHIASTEGGPLEGSRTTPYALGSLLRNVAFDNATMVLMANGKKGDTPLTDLLHWEVEVFHPKVDQLIRELDAEGGLDEWSASRYINLRAEWWQNLDKLNPTDSPSDSIRRKSEALRNLAMELAFRLAELRGEVEPNQPWSLPPEWDPTTN